jgi:acyl carrier protein
MVVEEKFAVKVPEGAPARKIFASVNALVAHIVEQRAATADKASEAGRG